ncbi:hypothetical protein EGW08_004520 [Elysia chlorotica]|uniref:Uncharacterized protein n=1 Tax=Elysia chlorotica TaxID=188477 RepID=A0A433U1G7_ELYCH|nr:hypothetical protein EGW08_004520 [Elysia chlorotica]
MTSTVRKTPGLHHANPRAVLRTKLTNDVSMRASTARPSNHVTGGMSPEARAAMLLTREETKDSLTRARHTSLPRANTNLSIVNKNKIAASGNGNIRNLEPLAPIPTSQHRLKPSPTSDSGSRERSKPAASTSDFNDSGFSSVRRHPLGAAAANTIIDTVTDTDDKFEMDSNNNSSIKTNARQHRQHRALSRISRKHPTLRKGNSLDADDDEYYEDGDSLEDGFSPGRTLTNANLSAAKQKGVDRDSGVGDKSKDKAKTNSFVMALDAALEANCISRLRGDITDQAEGIGAAPGTVRALNGGRLSNAQEVVVNVCHGDCEKELVFHDDDDDSLDTARAASEIRVNTWLEYNENFPPEELDYDSDADADSYLDFRPDTAAAQATKSTKTTLRVPTARVKSSVKPVNNKNQLIPIASSSSTRGGGKPPVATRRDSNNNKSNNYSSNTTSTAIKNNSAGSARSKSGTTTSQRDNSSSRFGSGLSNDGSSKRSAATCSATKRESFLARKAKA